MSPISHKVLRVAMNRDDAKGREKKDGRICKKLETMKTNGHASSRSG